MPVLTEDIKRFIVMELAMYRTPSEIAKAVKEEYGVDVDRRHVHTYDPEGVGAKSLADKWKELHAATRKALLEETVTIPIAQRAFRLRELERAYRKAIAMPNYVLAAQLLEQAAKEAGGSFTNKQKHEHAGPGGKPLPAPTATVVIGIPDNGRG